ncbi:MAG: effector-associated domain EAD1-containing protein [Calothrix sp. MO_167.B42]|nr:effector-associated domain EAD1-containing protein [Calothrix sp. MO_167.B42]
MNLSGQQEKRLVDALLDAFPDKASLEQMLSFELDKNLDAIAGGRNLQQIVFNLIKTSKSENWIEGLIKAARSSNSGNSRLKAIAKELLENHIVSPEPTVLLPGERRRLETERDELQEQFDFLSEEIQFLQQSQRTDDLSPKQGFRLKKQIEQAKEERQQISDKIKILESNL